MPDAWYRIGHVTDDEGRTGCTTIVFEGLVPATVDVRGGASGTRETALLSDGGHSLVDAIVLSGGSAFGLATADGVMRFLAEQGRGFLTRGGPVPIVPAAILYDLTNGDPIRPTADWGYRAAATATAGGTATGAVGAGAGATVAKLGGSSTPGGLGSAIVSGAAGEVHAIVAVNAVGDIVRPADGAYLARAVDPEGLGRSGLELLVDGVPRARTGENTTLACVMIDAPMDRRGLTRAAVAAHDGLARCIVPAHTVFDGDTTFVTAREWGSPNAFAIASLCAAVTLAVETAIVRLFEDAALPD